MRHFLAMSLAAVIAGLTLTTPAASEGRTRRVDQAPPGGTHKASPYYRKGPQVKGYVARRGGYSFGSGDVINTYGDNRSIFGGASSYRDPMLDRQTLGGPFDHGFFFDSGIGPRGGNSPYLH